MSNDRSYASTLSQYEISRRAFIRNGSLVLLAGGCASGLIPQVSGHVVSSALAAQDIDKPIVRVGLVTDMHYADKKPAGSRHYRESINKLREAAKQFKKDQPDFVVELGDFIDAANSVEVEQAYLKRIQEEFVKLPGKKHYVLGNHCVDTLTKEEFLAGVGQKKSYYSFDVKGTHFVVLDSCFRSDGKPYGRKNFKWTDANVPTSELKWLKADLAAAKGKVIVFAHQRVDVNTSHGVRNGAEVRKVLEASGKVQAVFQGHNHINDHKLISGIHYCTLVAMVEGKGEKSNGYSTMDVYESGSIRISGFRKQKKYVWT